MREGLLKYLPKPPNNKSGWPWTVETPTEVYNPNINYPTISIVTPSFNQGKFIEETIRSILLQNYPKLNYIIIDGRSTDETIAIIKKYEQWLSFWASEPDEGQTDAINKGISKVVGDVFNWVNSDDYLAWGALENVGRHFAKDSINLFCGRQIVFDHIKLRVSKENVIFTNNIEETIYYAHFHQPCAFWSMGSIRAIYPLNISLHYTMDIELWVNFLFHHELSQIIQTDIVTTFFRHHDNSKSIKEIRGFLDDKKQIIYKILFTAGIPNFILERWIKQQNINPIFSNKFDIKNADIKLGKLFDQGLNHLLHLYPDTFPLRFNIIFFIISLTYYPIKNLKGYIFLISKILIPLNLRKFLLSGISNNR